MYFQRELVAKQTTSAQVATGAYSLRYSGLKNSHFSLTKWIFHFDGYVYTILLASHIAPLNIVFVFRLLAVQIYRKIIY